MTKSIVLVLLCSSLLSSCGTSSKTTIIDDSVLYIGVPALYSGSPVELTINVDHNSLIKFDDGDSFVVPGTSFATLANQDENIVFVNLADILQKDYLIQAADFEKYISSLPGLSANVYSPVTNIRSADFSINRPGIYFLNPAIVDGGEPYSSSFAFCYKEVSL